MERARGRKSKREDKGIWSKYIQFFVTASQIATNLEAQNTLYYLIASWVRSLTRFQCQLGLWYHQRLDLGKIHFQTFSGCWENSIHGSCRINVLFCFCFCFLVFSFCFVLGFFAGCQPGALLAPRGCYP